jgi:hypothetical protein
VPFAPAAAAPAGPPAEEARAAEVIRTRDALVPETLRSILGACGTSVHFMHIFVKDEATH